MLRIHMKRVKHCDGSKAVIEYSSGKDDVYKDIDKYTPQKT